MLFPLFDDPLTLAVVLGIVLAAYCAVCDMRSNRGLSL